MSYINYILGFLNKHNTTRQLIIFYFYLTTYHIWDPIFLLRYFVNSKKNVPSSCPPSPIAGKHIMGRKKPLLLPQQGTMDMMYLYVMEKNYLSKMFSLYFTSLSINAYNYVIIIITCFFIFMDQMLIFSCDAK